MVRLISDIVIKTPAKLNKPRVNLSMLPRHPVVKVASNTTPERPTIHPETLSQKKISRLKAKIKININPRTIKRTDPIIPCFLIFSVSINLW